MSLKALILAAGYGTRLEEDIKKDVSGKYKHLAGVPKPLVPVGGKPLITHWIETLSSCHVCDKGLQDVYLVTNGKHYDQFVAWGKANSFPISNILNDGSTSNENRLGAIYDILLVVKEFNLWNDRLMIIGGDTLFFNDFDLRSVVNTFDERKMENLVLWYPEEDTTRTGILITDSKSMVVGFLEKPHPSETPSRQACPCFYIYRPSVLKMLETYLTQCKSLKERDAPGNLLTWLYSRASVYAYRISGRFDIGGLDTYIVCDQFFQQQQQQQQQKQNQNQEKKEQTDTTQNKHEKKQ